MKEEQQQQQQPLIHRAVLNSIETLENPRYRDYRHQLDVYGYGSEIFPPPIDQQSSRGLRDVREVVITELNLYNVKLVSDPSPDGVLNVLKDFFGRSDTTLTKSHLGSL